MLRKTTVIFALLIATTVIYAEDRDSRDDVDFTHHRSALTGALTSSDAWQVEISYHYMFWRYLGVGGSAGAWGNYYEDGFASGNGWEIDDDDNKPGNVYLRPSIRLCSPAITIGSVPLSLSAEPGVMFNIPYRRAYIKRFTRWPDYEYEHISTTGGQWLAVDLRLGVHVDIGRFGLTLGYLMSNLDIYSQTRHLSYKGTSFRTFYPSKPFMQGVFASISGYF